MKIETRNLEIAKEQIKKDKGWARILVHPLFFFVDPQTIISRHFVQYGRLPKNLTKIFQGVRRPEEIDQTKVENVLAPFRAQVDHLHLRHFLASKLAAIDEEVQMYGVNLVDYLSTPVLNLGVEDQGRSFNKVSANTVINFDVVDSMSHSSKILQSIDHLLEVPIPGDHWHFKGQSDKDLGALVDMVRDLEIRHTIFSGCYGSRVDETGENWLFCVDIARNRVIDETGIDTFLNPVTILSC
jgi:hypothetical protein